MSSNRTQTRNLLFSWGGHATTLLVMFFLSPYIIGKLDAVSYGIWSLLNVLTGYMGLFDLGVRSSVGRHIALYLGKRDAKGVDETIRTGLGFFSLIGGVILLVGICLGILFPYLFHDVPKEHYFTVRVLLPLMVFNVWLTTVAAIYSSVLTAHDRFDITRGVDMTVLAVRTAGTVFALSIGSGLWGLAVSLLVSSMVAIAGNYFFAHKQYPRLRSWPFLYTRKRLREITGYGFAAFITSASLKIIGQTDLVIVGALLAVASVREYSVGAMLVFYSGTFITIIEGTLFPATQRAAARSDMETVRWLFFRQIRIAILFGIPLFIGMAFFSKTFIRLWMLQSNFDENSVILSAGVMSILSIAKLPLLFIGGSTSVLAARGRIQRSANLTLTEAVLNVAFSTLFILQFGWGLYGIAAGTLVATLLVRATWVPLLACKEAGISNFHFLSKLIIPSGISALFFAAICFVFFQFYSPATWFTFALSVLTVLLMYAPVGMMILLPEEYRKRFFNFGHRLLFKS